MIYDKRDAELKLKQISKKSMQLAKLNSKANMPLSAKTIRETEPSVSMKYDQELNSARNEMEHMK